jgi:hypothetical protein
VQTSRVLRPAAGFIARHNRELESIRPFYP